MSGVGQEVAGGVVGVDFFEGGHRDIMAWVRLMRSYRTKTTNIPEINNAIFVS